MKLIIVKPGRGAGWVKSGIKTFARQPLALSGLFFIFLAIMSVINFVPVIGGALALVILPAATVGLMTATREADAGRFPMPVLLFSAMRGNKSATRAMVILGGLYAAGVLLILFVAWAIDGGQLAKLYLGAMPVTPDLMLSPGFQTASLVSIALYLPLSMFFWHAPALVHWHGLPPVKALFFSIVACMRNFGAFAVYSLTWFAVFLVASFLVMAIAALAGGPTLAATLMFPLALLLGAMYFTSIEFSVRDCFSAEVSPIDTGEMP